jgi:PhoPQ-activated pathogenicity-related protein
MRRFAAAFFLAAVAVQAACTSLGSHKARAEEANHATPLDQYVAAADPAYAWEAVRDLPGEGCTAHVLKMTSQTWRTSEDVDHTVWWHWLTIVEPEEIRSDIALLYIHGGDNDDPPPDAIRPIFARIARETGSVVAELRMVPNQPLRFTGDPDAPRKEDRLIAFAWSRFLNTGDPTWLPRLPMTKSAVRAMDTITAYFAARGKLGAGPEAAAGPAAAGGGGPRVDRFVVTGASKRGWTTWTTAVVDRRVVAIIPMVIDLLNVEASFQHHFAAYGFWAPAIHSYVERGVPDWFGTRQMRRLREIVDPYSYRDRLTMPKLIINATGDQFFVPDSSQLYYDDLPGEKHLRYVPNADHSMKVADVEESVLAFYRAVVTGAPRPDFSWTFEPDGSIDVRPMGTPAPREVRMWQATNPHARDFRLETIGPAWRDTVLAAEPDGSYKAAVPPPASGWSAFFVELTYGGVGDDAPLKLTTQVRILPDVLPFASSEVIGNSSGGEVR